MQFSDAVKAIKRSNLFDEQWYKSEYPDVSVSGMKPVEHYIKYGAKLGRRPNRNFDVNYYAKKFDISSCDNNPLLHCITNNNEGEIKNNRKQKNERDEKLVEITRDKLFSLGFTEQPLKELQGIAEKHPNIHFRAKAARELCMWHMRSMLPEGYSKALSYIEAARTNAPDLDFLGKLSTLELLCHHFLEDPEGGSRSFERAALAGECSPDLMLAWVNFQQSPRARLAWINEVLKFFGTPTLRLLDGNLPAYDRMTAAGSLSADSEGPKISVLIAAYSASSTIATALRSLQEQTWKNLEIFVLDDCSPDNTCAVVEQIAASDSRVKLVRMQQNGGAYVARNCGLDLASGEYVTIHDADDWSHPLKLETQIRHLMERPDVIGCTSQQARATSVLGFTRWTGSGQFIITNTSSFMFRKHCMKEHFGYWDTVRFSADMELIRRIRHKFGHDSITQLPTGPLSFQRDSDSSIVADDTLGASRILYGVRRQYLESQKFHHSAAETLRYGNDPSVRPFPVPEIMRVSKSARATPKHFDVILASDFRMLGGSNMSNAEEIKCQQEAGLKTAVVPMFRYDFSKLERPIVPEVWDLIDGESTSVLAYGEEASCDLLILRYPPILQHRIRYLPSIEAKKIKIIINQPPMSDYGPNGVVRYDLQRCVENVRHYFRNDADWHPIGPLVRSALHEHHQDQLHHINLASWDWHNIIDVRGWSQGEPKRPSSGKLRIGRHSRDHAVKWPSLPQDILAAYPHSDDVEVHILGGAQTVKSVTGEIPSNWTVHEFGALHPRDFLADIDVFVYFSHPDWVESFGRTIIEAMAAGLPVILPEAYRPLFADAALYATPGSALSLAKMLHADSELYAAQSAKALSYVREQFSFENHIRRLQAAGVNQ